MTAILRYTVPCPPVRLTEALTLGAGQPRFYFESAQSALALAGWGVAARLSAGGGRRFAGLGDQLPALWARVIDVTTAPSAPPPAVIGGGAFAVPLTSALWRDFPAAALVLPRVAVQSVSAGHVLSIHLPVAPGETTAQVTARARHEAERVLARLADLRPLFAPPPADLACHEGDFSAWERAVRTVTGQIAVGAVRKVVLARTARVAASRPFDVPALLARLGELCPGCFRFLFEFAPGVAFAGATPERLASVSGAHFATAAVAGSIRRGDFPAEDAALGQQLLASDKDQREHAFVVEQIRARMAPLARALHIPPAPALMRLHNIQHLHTPITGALHPDHSLLDIVSALHPTPAVGGVPGPAALTLIRQLEDFERGWYAAPLGWVNARGDGDVVVGLRSGLFRGAQATLFGGAGLVADSDPRKEWDETGLKIRFVRQALEGVPA